jgi:histidyl-tRNA synthetase
MSSFEGSSILRASHRIGCHHGFTPLQYAVPEKKGRYPYPESLKLDDLDDPAKALASVCKAFKDGEITPSTTTPYFVWHSNITAGRPTPKNPFVQFCALGSQSPLTDAVLMRAMVALMKEFDDHIGTISVNSLGDKETRVRYQKDLTNFFRRHAGTYSDEVAELAKHDVVKAAIQFSKEPHPVEIPRPTDHLSEASRKHFEAVLDYLEATDTPFTLAQNLLRDNQAWHDTCFEVKNATGTLSVTGGRSHELPKHFFKSLPVPTTSAMLTFTMSKGKQVPSVKLKIAPSVMFVHIGDEAKRLTMRLTNALFEAKLPMMQTLPLESLSAQMQIVDKVNPAYLVIIGREEATKGVVKVRHRDSYNEVEVPISPVSLLIKHLSKVAQ